MFPLEHRINRRDAVKGLCFSLTAGGVGLLSGCDPNQRSQARTALQVAEVLLLVLPIAAPAAAIIGLAIEYGEFTLDFMTVVGTIQEMTCPQATSRQNLTADQQQAVTQQRPVTLTNQRNENLNSKVSVIGSKTLLLSGVDGYHDLTYRCPRVLVDTVPTAVSRNTGSSLNYLEVPWQGRDLGDGRSVIQYGGSPAWQTRRFVTVEEAVYWKNQLEAAQFETRPVA